jgi:cytochrome c-type biogenesis protein CcmH/NrfF
VIRRRRAASALLAAVTATFGVAAALALATGSVAAASAASPRASLTAIEQDVMCVVCKTPLAVSQAPEADRERAFISNLIAKGETKPQIERQMVVQYGPAVLALPPAHGFNLTVYVLPPAVVVIGAALLAYTLPKWRRRTRADAAKAAATAPPPKLAPDDSQRLEEDLARFGR